MNPSEYVGRHRLSNHWGWRGVGPDLKRGCIDCTARNLHQYCRFHPAAIKVNLNGGAFKWPIKDGTTNDTA